MQLTLHLLCAQWPHQKNELWAVHMVGAILFYYGDNITYIADNYGESLDWSEQVIDNHRNAATITVGLAVVFFCFVPTCLRKVANKCGIHIADSAQYSAFDTITTIAKLEALSTLMVRISPIESCDKTISISFLVLCSIAGMVLIVTYCCMYLSSDPNNDCIIFFPLLPPGDSPSPPLAG
jgi:hypothetical protein